MKVSEFLIGVEQWLNSHNKIDGYTFRNNTDKYRFINEFEVNNISGSRINMTGTNVRNFVIRNTITSVVSDELKVTIITKFDENGESIKLMSWVDLKNLYNGFISGINKRLIDKYGENAIKRPYFTGNGKSEVNNNKIPETKPVETKEIDEISPIRDFINNSDSVRLSNMLFRYDKGLIDKNELIKQVNRYKSKKSAK